MKTKIVALLSIFFIASTLMLSAQKKKDNKQQVLFDVSMTCENCKRRIEKTVSFEKGVTDLKVDLLAKTVFVEFQENKTDSVKIKQVIEKLGYTVGYHTGNK